MAASSGPAGVPPRAETFGNSRFSNPRSGYTYSISPTRDSFLLTIRKAGSANRPITRRLAYFVGSGAVARSYLIDVDGFLYEAPVSYYAASPRWSFAPGYERYSYPFLARAVVPGCLECHASGVKSVADTQNGYERPPFLEGGVSCERCHGPGLAHVHSARAADIVNPARLAAARRDSVCDQCHLAGDVRIQRAGATAEFHAGEKFSDWAAVFAPDTGSAQATVTSHAANLAQSACKRAGGDRLWCGSCHDAHSTPSNTTQWFRAKCLGCHAESACREKNPARVAAGDNCVGCHMPRRPVTDAQHVVYTDHSIRRRPGSLQNKPNPQNARLVPLNMDTADSRDLGLAYAVLAAREQNPAYRERAFELLRGVLQNKPDDAQVLSYLADLYRARSEDREAIRLYDELLRVDPGQSSAPAALGAYAMERGNYQEAIRLWTRALRISPALLLVRANLAVALIQMGRRDEARAILEKALEFNPEFPAACKLLAEIK
jgi:hypothetical protein